MRGWVTERLGARADKVSIIPNSFDTELYHLAEPRPARDGVRVLAVARFVEKKGLVHLVEAFRRLGRADAELWLVGRGPEEGRLRRAAAGDARIKFLGAVSEEETRRLYREADVFCLPCVQTARRDADGIPTTILEAMAMELPVVTSDLLSAPSYVRHEREGLLTRPGDERSVAEALERLCGDADLRARLGRAGRERVAELCDIRRNVRRLEQIMHEGQRVRWRGMLAALEERRKNYTPETERYYDECRRRAVEFFAPEAGRLLDIGCGTGKMRAHLPEGVGYFGCDPLVTEPPQSGFPFALAKGEALPFADGSFDHVLLYCVLPNVLSVGAVLSEAARVLRPGGRLFVRECVNDPNPIHLNHLTDASLLAHVSAHFGEVESRPDGDMMVLLRAVKQGRAEQSERAGVAAPVSEAATAPRVETVRGRPLASVCITTYNRERYVRAAVESALRQTYKPLEVVVVDDGSTDGTPRLLEEFEDDVRLIRVERNGGIARAKNLALRATSEESRYVAVLDSDDIFHPRFVERCVERLEADPAVGLVYTDEVLIDAEGRELRRREAVEPWSVEAWLKSCNLRGDTWLARRELVMLTALHDEELSHDVDYDLFYQLLELTTFAHLREALVYYREHEGQSGRQVLALAKCHAANLVKYGYSPEYAYSRARRNPEWLPAIREGLALGARLREQRERARAHGPSNGSNGRAAESENVAASTGANGNGAAAAPAKENGAAARKPALAVEGGRPVRETFLPFGAPCLGDEEVEEVAATLRSGWIGTGPRAERFEEEFAAYVGARHAVSLSSCTAGLFLSLLAAGVGPGDEVITTPLTFAATVNVIEHAGARPVLADVDPSTLNLDPSQVERAVTPRTRAVIPVHFGGLPCDMDALNRVAEARGLAVVEDAAHATGARYRGRMAGALARAASFSFYANKNLTTGEGGMVTTDDAELAERVRLLRLHGLSGDAWRRFSTRRLMRSDVLAPGYKLNMTDIAAALGLHQLRKQERFMETRERYAAIYDEAFAGLPARRQPRPAAPSADRHALHLYTLVLEEGRWRVPRDEVVAALLAENVGAAIHYRAVHTHPFYRDKYGFRPEDFPHAFAVGESILSLPLTPAMSERDLSDVIAAVRKVAAAYAT
jgi:dTDP-4-amino-4,6-dideoxygalactose transaminase/glycosyltransferase involved in cell wall biosynthesis/ubiquinone/menaquinone biosynthesis C-methylase UbiE